MIKMGVHMQFDIHLHSTKVRLKPMLKIEQKPHVDMCIQHIKKSEIVDVHTTRQL